MAKRKTITASVALTATMAGLVIAGAGGTAQASPPPVSHTLAGSAVPFTSHNATTGTVAATRKLTIEAWLSPRTSTAEAYATEVSTPGNALYGHYLSPSAYTARFGATAAEAAATESWLRSRGFTSVSADAQRNYVRATATVANIDSAFKTQLRYYQSSKDATAGRNRLFANAGALTVPASLAGVVEGVTGVDNALPSLPMVRRTIKAAKPAASGPTYPCSAYWGQHTATATYKQNGTTTYPTSNCGYSASQFRFAYGANSANNGKGQTVALVELGLTPGMFTTLKDYASANGIPAPSLARYKELNVGNVSFTQCGDAFYGEETLDVEAAYDMAPGANELVVGGDGCDTGFQGLQGLFDADTAVLGGNGKKPLATIASNSWESGVEAQPAFITSAEHSILLRAAAEGVGMYFSAGDGSGVLEPSSDPYAIAVGGTTLGIGQNSKKQPTRVFESGWSTNAVIFDPDSAAWVEYGEAGATGGGPSLLWSQPSYQKGIVPKSLATAPGNRGGLIRSAPDISADADPFTGMSVLLQDVSATGVVTGYETDDIGGTSLASPLVAGIVAAAQQGQKKAFGFLDPAIYKIGKTSAIHDSLPLTAKSPVNDRQAYCDQFYCGVNAVLAFDDQSNSMYGYDGQVTQKGYDNMTGVGTPNGQTFITALRKLLK